MIERHAYESEKLIMASMTNALTAAVVTSGLIASAAATGQTVAITEFLNNSAGVDEGREWVELYNYGNEDVNLNGWTLGDEDIDTYTFGDVTIPAGGFLIVVGGTGNLSGEEREQIFADEWLNGTPDDRVIGIDGDWALANSGDEIVLSDEMGNVVWSLAYADDETDGFSTFLTSSDYEVMNFGSKAEPGVVREGFDNGTNDFLGYESQDSINATDPNAYGSLSDDFGSPFFVVDGGSTGLSLEFLGACPGNGSFSVENATPNGNVAIIYGFGAGPTTLPNSFPCPGTVLNVGNPRLEYRIVSANGAGVASLQAFVPAAACGRVQVQALDLSRCDVSNVVSP